MLYPLSLLSILLLFLIHLTSAHEHNHDSPEISSSTRKHWIRRANLALHELASPCPFGAFGTAIVNHTDLSTGPHGKLVCLGVNDVASGNPTIHGEVAAINNCSSLFRASKEDGGFGMSGQEAGLAWRDLSLYTNGEPCPMVLCLFLISTKFHLNFYLSPRTLLTLIMTVRNCDSLGRIQGVRLQC